MVNSEKILSTSQLETEFLRVISFYRLERENQQSTKTQDQQYTNLETAINKIESIILCSTRIRFM